MSFTQAAGTGTTTFEQLLDLSGAFAFTGNNLTLNGVGDNTIGTSMTVSNAGTFTTADAAYLVVGNEFVQNGAGTNLLGGNITSSNDGIAFAKQITLQGSDVVVMTSAGGTGDDIVLGTNRTTDVLGANQALTLNAGALGNITVNGDVGATSTDRLGVLIISNAQNATFNGTVTAVSFTQAAGTGTTTFNGALVTPTLTMAAQVNNLSLNGTGTTITNPVSFVNRGTLSLGSASGSQTYTDGITVNGPSDGPISTSLAGAITSSGNQTYTGPVLLSAATALSGNDILFNSIVDGAHDLTIVSGTTTFKDDVGSITPLNSLFITATTINMNGSKTITTTGAQTYDGAVVFGDDPVLQGNQITFKSTIDGSYPLKIIDTGTTTFSGEVGGLSPLDSLEVFAAMIRIGAGAITTYKPGTPTGFQNYRSSAISFTKETVLTGYGIKFTSTPRGTSYKLNDYADLSRFGMVVPASNGSGDTANKKASDAAKTAARAAMFIIIPASGSYRSTLGPRQERYALLPDDDGKVGAITVTLAGKAEVLVKDAYSSISVDNGSTVDGADPNTTKEIYRNMQDAVPSNQ